MHSSCYRHCYPSVYTTEIFFEQLSEGSGGPSNAVAVVLMLHINIRDLGAVIQTLGRSKQLKTRSQEKSSKLVGGHNSSRLVGGHNSSKPVGEHNSSKPVGEHSSYKPVDGHNSSESVGELGCSLSLLASLPVYASACRLLECCRL